MEQLTTFARTNFHFRGGSNPVWDRTHGNHMALELCEQASAISISIWNANVMADDKIGEVLVKLEPVALKLGRKRLLPVDTGGELEVTILVPSAPARSAPSPSLARHIHEPPQPGIGRGATAS